MLAIGRVLRAVDDRFGSGDGDLVDASDDVSGGIESVDRGLLVTVDDEVALGA